VDSATPWAASYPHVVVTGEEERGGPPTTYGAGIDKFKPGTSWTSTDTRFTYRIPLSTDAPPHLHVSATAHPGYESTLTYDTAPDSGTIPFELANRDGDGFPDFDDPCPDGAYSEPPTPWYNQRQHYGCPSETAPFTAAAFTTSARRAANALRRLWQNPRQRTMAMKRRSLRLAFTVPAGPGLLVARVAPVGGPPSFSVYGGRRCQAGRCVLRFKVNPKRVRSYARRKLQIGFTFVFGSNQRTAVTIVKGVRLRMPL
jgi:hypothetical protein